MTIQTRREFLSKLIGIAGATSLPQVLITGHAAINDNIIDRKIPGTGETLACIGMGTHRTFDVDDSPEHIENLTRVTKIFFSNGGSLIDSSPMYGNAETIIGKVLGNVKENFHWFAATKVWTDGRQEGIEQMSRSLQRMGVKQMDLMQIHNLRDWKTHLQTLKDWKAQGKIRYIGVTTSHGRDHDELIDLLKKETFDFVQFSYNILNREVESYLLPLAQDKGIATIINRPFQKGQLFRLTKGKILPEWAKECDCSSWAQVFLKFILSHPAVTCIIPATSNAKHMQDNMRAGYGRVPDKALIQTMTKFFESL